MDNILIRTGVFGRRVSLGGGCLSLPRVYSFVCKPRVFKFGTQLKMGKSTIGRNNELDMTNCDVIFKFCHR